MLDEWMYGEREQRACQVDSLIEASGNIFKGEKHHRIWTFSFIGTRSQASKLVGHTS